MSLYADLDGRRSTATPATRASCCHCGGEMVAHCGPIKAWHWAHLATDCDPWTEPESAWHLGIKRWFHQHGCAIEQRIDDGFSWHVADVVTPSGAVIELQHSPLDTTSITRREAFYGNMIWIWDTSPWVDRLHFGAKGFWWKHGSRAQASCTRPILWHFDGELWWVKLNDVQQREYIGELDGQPVWHVTDRHRVLGRIIATYPSLDNVLHAWGSR